MAAMALPVSTDLVRQRLQLRRASGGEISTYIAYCFRDCGFASGALINLTWYTHMTIVT